MSQFDLFIWRNFNFCWQALVERTRTLLLLNNYCHCFRPCSLDWRPERAWRASPNMRIRPRRASERIVSCLYGYQAQTVCESGATSARTPETKSSLVCVTAFCGNSLFLKECFELLTNLLNIHATKFILFFSFFNSRLPVGQKDGNYMCVSLIQICVHESGGDRPFDGSV